jgi:hypothetical protein
MLAMVAEKISHAFTAAYLQMLVTQTPLMLMILTRRSVLIWTISKVNQVAVTDFFRKWIKMNESLIDLVPMRRSFSPFCLCLKV